MAAPELVRRTSFGVTLLGDPHRPGGVTLGFTERTGGFSTGCYDSLDLGNNCGDDPALVDKNRRLTLKALGMEGLYSSLVNPLQVHGDKVVTVGAERAVQDAQEEALRGADAIVCAQKDVPVLLCYADCVPVVLVAPGAFAVVHSGWRGTILRIAAKALDELVRVGGCAVQDVQAYIGPHIGVADYEVSSDILERFVDEFGPEVTDGSNLDLGMAVRRALTDEGLLSTMIAEVSESTASNTDRFYSYRAERGTCGRYGAIACMVSLPREV